MKKANLAFQIVSIVTIIAFITIFGLIKMGLPESNLIGAPTASQGPTIDKKNYAGGTGEEQQFSFDRLSWVKTNGNVHLIPGILNKAYFFDGGYADIPVNINEEFSLSFWFLATGKGAQTLIDTRDPLGVGVALRSNGQMTFTAKGSKKFALNMDSEESYKDGEWHYVVYSIQGFTAKGFVDGVEVASQSLIQPGTNLLEIESYASSELRVGNKKLPGSSWGPLHGAIDELKISNKAQNTNLPLTPPQKVEVFNPEPQFSSIYDAAFEERQYNHGPALALYKGIWYAAWNGNTVSVEGKPGQLVYLSTSYDFKTWSQEVSAFSLPEYSTNPVVNPPLSDTKQWQPSFVVVDEELWCFWNDNHRAYLSVLSSPNAKWQNYRLLDGSTVTIDGVEWKPKQGAAPIVDSAGRVLLPITLVQKGGDFWSDEKLTAVLISDKDPASWTMSETTSFAPEKWVSWEPTIAELDDGTFRMYVRSLDWSAPQFLHTSTSTDAISWTTLEPVYLQTISSRAHFLKDDSRYYLILNDAPPDQPDMRSSDERKNLAMFLSPDGNPPWLAATSISGDTPGTAYPQSFIHQGNLYTVYSERYSQSITGSKIPLPDKDSRLFVRNTVGQAPKETSSGYKFSGNQFVNVHLEPTGIVNLQYTLTPIMQGYLFDSRKGPGGFAIILKDTEQGLELEASVAGNNIKSGLFIPKGLESTVNILYQESTLTLTVNDESKQFEFPFEAVSSEGVIGYKQLEKSVVKGFMGTIKKLHISNNNDFSSEKGFTIKGGEFTFPENNEIEVRDEFIKITGSDSIGVYILPEENVVSFSYEVEQGTPVVATLGEFNNPIRIIAHGNKLLIEHARGTERIFSDGVLNLEFDNGYVTISSQSSVRIPSEKVLYLGEGYSTEVTQNELVIDTLTFVVK